MDPCLEKWFFLRTGPFCIFCEKVKY